MEKITEVVIAPVKLPRKEAVALRYGTVNTLDNVFVALKTKNGIIGYGESAPIPPTFGETQSTIVEVLRQEFAPRIIGEDATNINQVIDKLDAIPGHLCAKTSIDIALHDLKGKVLGVPVSSLLGGSFRSQIPVAQTVGIDSIERATAKTIAAAKEGFPSLKLKGGRNLAHDVLFLTEVRKALGNDGPWLRLDFNQGNQNASEFWRYVSQLDGLKVDFLEEPFPARRWDDYRELVRRSSIPVCLDESLITDSDAAILAKQPSGFIANIKIQKNGGLHKSNRLANTMATLGIPVVIGAHRDAWISNTAGIHLAASIRELDYACDVRYAWSLQTCDSIVDGPTLEKGMASVPNTPGLGLEISWEKLLKSHAIEIYAVKA